VNAAFHPEAEAEMRAAARWYEERRPRLGEAFLRSVERAVAAVQDNPSIGAAIGSGLRWFLLRRFRYAVIYTVANDSLVILAVAHLRRLPGYWRERT
jgi:plasmid stabilization system protein ParE